MFKNFKTKMKNKITISLLVFLVIFSTISGLLIPNSKSAQAVFGVADVSFTTIVANPFETLWNAIKKAAKLTSDLAFKSAVRGFLQKIAYDSAVYLASGGAGQEPLFWTNPAKELEDVADAAVGDYLDGLSREVWGKSLCDPPPAVKIKLDVYLRKLDLKGGEPKLAGRCPISKAAGIWEKEIDKYGNALGRIQGLDEGRWKDALQKLGKTGLIDFSKTFNPEANEMGMFLSMISEKNQARQVAKEKSKFEAGTGSGFKALKSTISDDIKTPKGMIEAQNKLAIEKAVEPNLVYTGSPIADALGVFTNTLTKKLMQRIFKEGFNFKLWRGKSAKDVFGNLSGSRSGRGIAEAMFASLKASPPQASGAIDLVTEFESCPDAQYAQVNNCVIDKPFADALRSGDSVTIQEALEQGYLHGHWTVGENRTGDNKLDRLSRYSLTNIKKLRKARILPLGFEIAAQELYNMRNIVQLQTIVNAFYDSSSSYYHLIDPDWVLKSPLMRCDAMVYGSLPQIDSDQRVQVCADEKHCITEREDGSCSAWGYCTQEKNVWRLNGDACPEYYNSCESYVSDNSNQSFDYLESTLEMCQTLAAGCSRYTLKDGDQWSIDDGIYFNQNAIFCDAKDSGCNKFLRVDDGSSGMNLPDVLPAEYYNDPSYADNSFQEVYLKEGYASCYAEDVGCTVYYPENGDPGVPAVVEPKEIVDDYVVDWNDECPGECVGYDTYYQSATNFDLAEPMINFIPQTAKSCPVSDVGCSEFTNLDEASSGGERKEYFTDMRRCQKPDDNCQIFYTWVGSDQVGFQLRSYSLKSVSGQPVEILNPRTDFGSCENRQDAQTNPHCREFYNILGRISYNIFENTISCADQCHRYRKTESDQVSCLATDGDWVNDECIYMAIPGQGTRCSVKSNSCKEYKGNYDNNIEFLLRADFENNNTSGWEPSQNVSISSSSLEVGQHSMLVSDSAYYDVTSLIQVGQSYQLEFWIKQISTVEYSLLNASFVDSIVDPSWEVSFDGGISIKPYWSFGSVGPLVFNPASFDGSVYLKIEDFDDDSFYIDNIILKRANNYFIKNTWETPQICEQPIPGAMAGCGIYKDSNKLSWNLRSFDYLCSPDNIGCEKMIDTHNSADRNEEQFNTGNGSIDDDVVVPADNIVYAVYDEKYKCKSQKMGCEELGFSSEDSSIESIYLLNTPDDYSKILCSFDEAGCESYNGDSSVFKSPGENICEYATKDVSGEKITGWFKKETNQGCRSLNDFSVPVVSDSDYTGWAGQCSSDYSGCTLFVDPTDSGSQYTYIDNEKLDRSSCNGQVGLKDGCVLFNDTSNTDLTYDSVQTYQASSNTNPPDSLIDVISSDVNDSNTILSVIRDRVCGEWLDCMSSTAVWDQNSSQYRQICYQLGRCDELVGEGESAMCSHWIITPELLLTKANYSSRDTSWSGVDYSGYSLNNRYVSSLSVKEDSSGRWGVTHLSSSGEDLGVNGRTCVQDADCDLGLICGDGRCIAPKSCRGYPESDSPFPTNSIISSKYPSVNKFEDSKKDQCSYQKVFYKQSREARYFSYKSDLASSNKYCIGGDPSVYRHSSTGLCETDSECGNPEDGGGRCVGPSQNTTYLGWNGYCLELDPSKPKEFGSCITWWPTDLASGDMNIWETNEFAGYSGPTPLYYCLQAKGNAPYQRPTRSGNDVAGQVSEAAEDKPSFVWCCSGIGNSTCSIPNGSYGCDGNCGRIGRDNSFCSLDGNGIINVYGETSISFGLKGNTSERSYNKQEITNIEIILAPRGILPQNNTTFSVNLSPENDWMQKFGEATGCNPSIDFKTDLSQFTCGGGDANDDCFAIRAIFNENNGQFLGFNVDFCDGSSEDGYVYFAPIFHLREPCQTIVKVADQDNNAAWTDRVWADNTEEIILHPDYGHRYPTASPPFGSAGSLEPGELMWFADGETGISAGAPFSCVGTCDLEIKQDMNNLNSPVFNPPCKSTEDAYSESLSNIFARALGVWDWGSHSFGGHTFYIKLSTHNYHSMGIDFHDVRGYKGKKVTIASVLHNKISNSYSINNLDRFSINQQDNGTLYCKSPCIVNLMFYAWADDNQMPIKDVQIDWNDNTGLIGGIDSKYKNHKSECAMRCHGGSNDGVVCLEDSECSGGICRLGFGDSVDACRQGYFYNTHIYICDNPDGCSYQPKVKIIDNWRWHTQGIRPSDEWKNFNGTIIVSPVQN